MAKRKIIIAGGRDFNDYKLLKQKCDYLLSKVVEAGDEIIIVSGQTRGADLLGEKYAYEKDYKINKYPANWKMYGKKAGYIRNEQMAKASHALIAFWDGESKGTKHMIDLAVKYNLKVRIVEY